MRILIFTHIFPYPLTEGGKTAQFNFIQEASKSNDIILVPLSKLETHLSEDFLKEIGKVSIEKINFKSDTLKHTFFQKVVRKIIWKLRNILPKPNSSVLENPYFINPVKIRSEDEINQIIRIVKKKNPDIVQIDFIDNVDLGILFAHEYKTCLVMHDIRSESVKQYAFEQGLSTEYINYLSKNVSLKELPFADILDGIVTFNDLDTELIKNWNKNVLTNPFAVNGKFLVNDINRERIRNLVFLGPEIHFPNVDALDWYARKVGKELFEDFGLKTKVIGKWSSTERFKEYSFIEFLGFVKDIKAEMDDSILVVPLRIGSGIRTKILEAFAMGVPVISSTKGIEGINAVDGVHYFKADNLEEYQEAVHLLLTDIPRINKMRKDARAFVGENFSQKKVTITRLKFYESIIKR